MASFIAYLYSKCVVLWFIDAPYGMFVNNP